MTLALFTLCSLIISSHGEPPAKNQNLSKILKEAKAIPVLGKNGNLKGYKVVEIRKGNTWKELDLKQGESIKVINGKLIDTPQDAMKIYQEIKQKEPTPIEATIERWEKN